jgi:hypothetical protein
MLQRFTVREHGILIIYNAAPIKEVVPLMEVPSNRIVKANKDFWTLIKKKIKV